MLGDATGCKGTRRDGSPCQAPMVGASGLCWAHDPAKRDAAHAARVQGGHGKRTAARLDRLVPSSLKPAIALLHQALEEVHRGDLDPRAAGAMAALAGAISRLYATGVLEERVSALEQSTGVRRA